MQSKVAGNDIIFGEKALAFLTNLLQQHHLALVFPFRGPVLSTFSILYTNLLLPSVFPWI